MGKGIDLARSGAPVHAAVLDDLKDQLLIALIKKLGGKVEMPVKEVDETGMYVLRMSVDPMIGMFTFEVKAKQ